MIPPNRTRPPGRRGSPRLEALEGRWLLNAPSTRVDHSSDVSLARVRAEVARDHKVGSDRQAHGHRAEADLLARDVIGYYGKGSSPKIGPGEAVPYYPSQVATAYGFNQLANQGQGVTIAIVDAYDDPNIVSDLAQFSRTFGLPQMDGVNGDPTFAKLSPQGQPAGDTTWALEMSLDVEWIHAMAPKANIDLVESLNNGDNNANGTGLYPAVQYAAGLPNVVVVSNSYGSAEYSGETAEDSFLTTPSGHAPVAFTASTGDSGAPGGYPAYSPNVVAIGGTSLYTLSSNGRYGIEYGWPDSGGGVSQYEARPTFQSSLSYSSRAIPDIAFDADPSTGVYVYDTYEPGGGGFYGVGGTSLASPISAAMIGLADQARIGAGSKPLSSAAIDSALYGAYNATVYLSDFHDITSGNNGDAAGTGYDLVTGIGSPKVPQVVQLLTTA